MKLIESIVTISIIPNPKSVSEVKAYFFFIVDFSSVDHEPVEKIVIKMSDMEKDINSKRKFIISLYF